MCPFRIGRLNHEDGSVFSTNDFSIPDKQPFQASRNHCSIEREGDNYFVRDSENSMIIGSQKSPYKFRIYLARKPPGGSRREKQIKNISKAMLCNSNLLVPNGGRKIYFPTAALTISEKPWASKLAPPTSAPSMSGWLRRTAAFAGFTLPPY